jgi:acetylornithine/succinyldiaminopimelate/putrescine aminotransferase
MLGIELSVEGAPYVTEAMNRGLLINCTHDHTLRLLPPFIVTRAQVREFLRQLERVFAATPRVAAAVESRPAGIPARAAHVAAR